MKGRITAVGASRGIGTPGDQEFGCVKILVTDCHMQR